MNVQVDEATVVAVLFHRLRESVSARVRPARYCLQGRPRGAEKVGPVQPLEELPPYFRHLPAPVN